MKYTVKVADKTYDVEIDDIYARPVIASVDGEVFEIIPESGIELDIEKEAGRTAPIVEKRSPSPMPVPAASQTTNPALGGKTLTSPLPGTVVEIFVKKGDQIEVGKVVLIIEAMKMKNSIRSVRTGKVAEVLVSAGQTVSHKQALVEFTE
jgi:biotin carboxyl carrier protein